jgi:gamma-butyrobetaine dioxygenase
MPVLTGTELIEQLAALFAGEGLRSYLGEEVSLATHMLQAGALAELADAPDHLVAAALLHDVGHLEAIGPGSVAPTAHVDRRHEDSGAAWLAHWFPESVTEPVRLHVAAKRYLCTVEPGYFGALSPTSVRTLELQGGPFSQDQVRAFESTPFAQDAVAVRRWDEAAKDPAAPTPSFDHFKPLLLSLTKG